MDAGALAAADKCVWGEGLGLGAEQSGKFFATVPSGLLEKRGNALFR